MDDKLVLGKLDQFWECPTCGFQVGMGEPGRITKAPSCQMGHSKAEMEQVMAGRFAHHHEHDD